MKKIKLLILFVQKNILSIIFICFTISLALFSKTNLNAAKSGLILFANSVVPSLLPFFIATELLSNTNIIEIVGKSLNKFMRPIFNLPGEGAYAFLIGIISGYPVGAKIVTKLRNDGICSKSEGERLLPLCNNSGPLFIIGTVGISLFANSQIGFLLLATHILSCITVGIVLGLIDRFSYIHVDKYALQLRQKKISQFATLGDILSTSIQNSINTVTMVGGFVVLFSVIISILQESNIINILSNFINPFLSFLNLNTNLSTGLVTGVIELTNGINFTSSIQNKRISHQIILCAFLLGFGGISILLQVLSIISKSDLSIKPYISAKLLQGLLAASYTYLAIQLIPALNFDLI